MTAREGAGKMRKYACTLTCAVAPDRPSSPEGFKMVTYRNPPEGSCQKCRFLGDTADFEWSRLGMGPRNLRFWYEGPLDSPRIPVLKGPRSVLLSVPQAAIALLYLFSRQLTGLPVVRIPPPRMRIKQ